MLPWATGPLTLLESIAKVTDQQVADPAQAKLDWSGLSVQVPECEARGTGGMLPH